MCDSLPLNGCDVLQQSSTCDGNEFSEQKAKCSVLLSLSYTYHADLVQYDWHDVCRKRMLS